MNEREKQESLGGKGIATDTPEEGHLGRSVSRAFSALYWRCTKPSFQEDRSHGIPNGNAITGHMVAKGIRYKDFTEVSADI